MATLSLRVPDAFKHDLEELAKSTQRSKTDILLSWCSEHLELEKWQIRRVEDGITASEDELFATDAQVAKAFKTCKS